MPKLEIKGITKVYKKGAVKALDGFSVTLNSGCVWTCSDRTVQANQHL